MDFFTRWSWNKEHYLELRDKNIFVLLVGPHNQFTESRINPLVDLQTKAASFRLMCSGTRGYFPSSPWAMAFSK
jgi:hypothetical protein